MISVVQDGPVALFAAFLVAHALADFPLQGEYLARHKVRSAAGSRSEWMVALWAHSVIHAGGVWLVSGSLAFAAVEWGLHALIDLGKGERKFGLIADQSLHVACKAVYVAVLCCWPGV